MAADTATRMNHLWSAGITYQGAHSVLVLDSSCPYAFWYAPAPVRAAVSPRRPPLGTGAPGWASRPR
jgi:hypothetical protein